MGMPTDVGAVDLMIAFPHADASIDDYTFRSLLRDEGSADWCSRSSTSSTTSRITWRRERPR